MQQGYSCTFPSREELDQAKDQRFSPEVHKKLKDSKVAVAGLGGLGSNIAVMLTRSGIGHLHLVDFDSVDVTNLNRQAYMTSHLGMKKTAALAQILREINPYLRITTRTVYVTGKNAAELFGMYPIVCEAFDRPENKAMLVNTLLETCPRTTVVAGSGMAGYGSSNSIITRRAMSRLYICGDGHSDVNDGIGLMAPRVAVCAGHQANMVIRLILGQKDV
ncbi:sulfur carrier protein ThiS adenylyltransferase ThiF [Ruminococcus gauvreauii]|uniref:Sulfur carrier protein ThiS adenylyltransferase ThiF n=1 Tax=Ruminococcus gauvreauii TaxID=438033 RepID=A0ABY5VCX2_9FIRM|nr:sulfur carrier protein ThiS adenylyltransferase ThiF [Ruminococcus gauvreauii]UWP58061.1 sulfur carrier protein ThiS adenylyltransferase ThiF [Ruminococcus gauvreauii]